jgi:hypothetical protein
MTLPTCASHWNTTGLQQQSHRLMYTQQPAPTVHPMIPRWLHTALCSGFPLWHMYTHTVILCTRQLAHHRAPTNNTLHSSSNSQVAVHDT